jgi:hypothetical protein
MYNNLFNLYRLCKDNITEIENFYEAISDRSEIYDCHHRLETHDKSGNLRDILISREELISQDLYYNRPASELVLIKKSEHSSLHRQFSNIDGHRYLNGDSRQAEYMREYRTDKEKYSKQLESNKKYQNKNKKIKEKFREYQKEYYQTDKGKESSRRSSKKYNSQLCLYNGETLALGTLSARFRRQGIYRPTAEAKKYLISD